MADLNPVTEEEIRTGYMRFLGRRPEYHEVQEAIARKVDIFTFFEWLVRLPAFQQRHGSRGPRPLEAIPYETRKVDLTCTDAQLAQMLDRVSQVWESLGDTEPHWSVLTHDEYKAGSIGGHLDAFYQSGDADIKEFMDICLRNNVVLPETTTVLDLGCGVGRVVQPLRRRFASYIGVDVSQGHLRHAMQHVHDHNIENTRFMSLPDFVADGALRFDVFFSLITLQHNAPPLMAHLIDIGLARLRPGGAAFFQLPCVLKNYSFRTDAYLQKPAGGGMEMHALAQRHVFALFQKHGCTPLEVNPLDKIGRDGLSYFFLAQKGRG